MMPIGTDNVEQDSILLISFIHINGYQWVLKKKNNSIYFSKSGNPMQYKLNFGIMAIKMFKTDICISKRKRGERLKRS